MNKAMNAWTYGTSDHFSSLLQNSSNCRMVFLSMDQVVGQDTPSSRVYWGQTKQDVFAWGFGGQISSNSIE
jgi:hypothetical protein